MCGRGLKEYRVRIAYISELIQACRISLNHLHNKSNGSEKYTMVAVCEKIFGFGDEVVCKVWDFLDDTECA